MHHAWPREDDLKNEDTVKIEDQAGIFPANPRTLFVGNSQSHRKS